MNSSTNVTLLFITIPILLVCIFVGFDLPLETLRTTGAQLPYLGITQWIMGGLVFLILARRSSKRWLGMQLLKQTNRFQWVQPIAVIRKKRATLYTLLEAAMFLYVGLGIHTIYEAAAPIYAAYFIGFVDSIVFAYFGGKRAGWKIGITKKAIVLADREVTVAYFYGLRKVHQSHETLYFDYVGDLQLSVPTAAISDLPTFINEFLPYIDREKVFLDDSIKKIL